MGVVRAEAAVMKFSCQTQFQKIPENHSVLLNSHPCFFLAVGFWVANGWIKRFN